MEANQSAESTGLEAVDFVDSGELVVLADEAGNKIGTAPKSSVHTTDTPLHFAFSCFLFDSTGRLLLTRRALEKKTWPGVWTNSFCGHPGPGESVEEAIVRRARQELGIEQLAQIQVVLPDFRYRAVDSSGIVEWEICPVYTAQLLGDIEPNPAEVDSWEWVNPHDILSAVKVAPFAFSPWLVEELKGLADHLEGIWQDLGTSRG